MGEHKGALNAAELWYSTGQFFVGDVSAAPPPLYVAIADDVDRMRLIRIDLNQYFDRAEARPFKAAEAPLPTASPELQRSAPSSVGAMTSIRRPQTVGALLSMGNRQLRVASSVEPVFEMKKLAMIGHRFEPAVMDAGTAVAIDAKALGNLDWNDREQIDVLNIEQGLALLRMRSPEQRKMVMVIPAAFSTFASVKARIRLMPIVSRPSQEMGLKVLFEIRHLQGVPAGRIAEVAAPLKPYCMTSMGQVPGGTAGDCRVKGVWPAGICIDYDGNRRDDAMLETYLAALNTAARSTAGACMIAIFIKWPLPGLPVSATQVLRPQL